MFGLEETIQRACEAGGESASPRRGRSRAWGTEPNPRLSPRSGRQMKPAEPEIRVFHFKDPNYICRQLRRLSEIGRAVTPGSASPSPGASTLSASFAGSLDVSLFYRQCSVETLSENKNLRTCYLKEQRAPKPRLAAEEYSQLFAE